MKLYAPKEFWELIDTHTVDMQGGCGPGRFGDWLVPDKLFGLSIRPACIIHDFCYLIGETIEDKEKADRIFLNNMVRIIKSATKWYIIKKLRLRQAYLFYQAVKRFGGAAFWDGKNEPEEFKEMK